MDDVLIKPAGVGTVQRKFGAAGFIGEGRAELLFGRQFEGEGAAVFLGGDLNRQIDHPSADALQPGLVLNQNVFFRRNYNLRAFAEFFYFSTKYLLFLAIWEILCTFGRKRKYLSCDLRLNGYGIIHRAEIVYPLKTILFENEQFPCPADEHQYLTDIYGDYKVIPPEEKRKIHAIYINPELDKL